MAWNKQETEDLKKLMFESVEEQLKSHYEQIDADIEYILRNKIDKPIKGEITKGKLHWRGIKDIAYGENFEFLGIMQRGKLVSK